MDFSGAALEVKEAEAIGAIHSLIASSERTIAIKGVNSREKSLRRRRSVRSGGADT